jgi:predicted pyridoxine 5'-phosphate oxidase superfamily flavin-nucleotide-binding protein
MSKLPKSILAEWQKKEGAVVITTLSSDNVPNSIYATCVSVFDDEVILVANNFFKKTLANIQNSCKGNVLFITKDGNAYQIKGFFEYKTEGALYDDMKKWNPESLPGKGVAVLNIEEIYSGGKKIL